MITCIAIDDEPIALSIIEQHCNRHGGLTVECYSSPVEGMERIAVTRPDIVFLDIEMNSHNGLDLARQLPEGTCLIFTTAYAQYALEGFNVDAVDFLHKPIFFERFEHAIDKAAAWLTAHRQPSAPATAQTITVKMEHKNVVIDLDSIIYIEAMDNYVKIIREDLPRSVSQITMKEMEAMLPTHLFARVHRSYIIAVSAVERYSSRRLFLKDLPQPIPVGRKYLSTFNALFNQSNY